MCEFSLCIGCPFDDPDFGCLRSPDDDCMLVGDVTRTAAAAPAPRIDRVLQECDE